MSPDYHGEYARMHCDGLRDGIWEFEFMEHVLSGMVEVHQRKGAICCMIQDGIIF